MKLSSKKITSLGTAGLILVAVISLPKPVRMQQPSRALATPSLTEPGTPVGADLIKVKTRAAIPFKPFEVRDPANGKAISRDTTLTLPDGKKLTAGQYYDELNSLESQFNKIGYTLKEPTDSRIELQATPVPVAAFQKQAQLLSAGVQKSRFEPLSLEAAAAEQAKMLTATPVTGLIPIKGKNFAWNSPPWGFGVGNPSVFAVSINGKTTLNGTPTSVTIHGEANANGSVFDQPFDILNAVADLNAQSVKGNGTVKLGVKVGGVSVYNLNQTVNASWSKTDTLQKAIDKSKNISFMLGPIPMNAKIGFAGSAGVKYSVAIAPLKASAQVVHFVDTKGYGQAGADIGVGGAGVGVNLVFLKADGNLSATLQLGVQNNKPSYIWNASYYHNLNILDGNANVYAYVYVPCFCPSSGWYKKKEWTWNLFSWSGFQSSGTLFNNSGSAPL